MVIVYTKKLTIRDIGARILYVIILWSAHRLTEDNSFAKQID